MYYFDMFSLLADISILGLLVAFSILAFLPESTFSHPEISTIALDIAHFPAFWSLQVVLHSAIKRLKILPNKYNLYVGTSISLSITTLLELVQPYFGRSQNFNDLALGILGLSFAATQFIHRENTIQFKHYRTLQIFILLITIQVIIPKLYTLKLKFDSLPILGDFENPYDIKLWNNINHIKKPILTRLRSPEGHGEYTLLGQQLDYPWSGVSFKNNQGLNISQYTHFKLYFYAEDKQTILHLRLDDINGNRGNANELSKKDCHVCPNQACG